MGTTRRVSKNDDLVPRAPSVHLGGNVVVNPLACIADVVCSLGVFGIRDQPVVCKGNDQATLCKIVSHVAVELVAREAHSQYKILQVLSQLGEEGIWAENHQVSVGKKKKRGGGSGATRTFSLRRLSPEKKPPPCRYNMTGFSVEGPSGK